jgi:hypothetical protein
MEMDGILQHLPGYPDEVMYIELETEITVFFLF